MRQAMQVRPARDFRYSVLSRADVEVRLERLVRGDADLAEVADWAMEFIICDDPQLYPEIADAAVWRALTALSGADLPTTDREYLHDENDFRSWLGELRAAK